MSHEWYEDFFSGLAVELWQKAIPADTSAREMEFAESQLRLAPGNHVLDIGCGHGRHAVPLAQAGLRVTGVDISPECLAAAGRAARAARVEVQWVLADLYRKPNLPSCDGVIWMGNGFGYADGKRTQALFVQLATLVPSGGRLLIDSGVIAESILTHFQENGEYQIGAVRMTAQRAYDPMLGRMTIEYAFYSGERVEQRLCRQWVFTLSQVRGMLEMAGWRLAEAFGNLDAAPYRLGDSYAYIVAEKT